MLNFRLHLTNAQKEELERELIIANQMGDWQARQRILAILALAEDQSPQTVANILRVSLESIRLWLKRFLTVTIKEFIGRKRSPGRPSKLTKTQRRKLEKLIDAGPEEAGFPGGCWRTPMIQELIKEQFGVFYSARYISQMLKDMGFSYQKACFEVGGKDPKNPEAREQWLQNKWPEIFRKAKEKHALILFGDEASFPQWGTLTYTWARKGKQPTVKTSGIRKGYKVFGLIEYFSGRFFHKAQEGRLNSESYIAFLIGVMERTTEDIFIIQDGASYHWSKAVTQFLNDHADRITQFQLPPYSPDFNPIEKLWRNIKEKETHLKYFPTFDSLTKKVDEALVHFENISEQILNLFGFLNRREAQTISL